MKMVNAKQIGPTKEGPAFGGFYLSTILLQAEEVTATFVREGTDTLADHFKCEVV